MSHVVSLIDFGGATRYPGIANSTDCLKDLRAGGVDASLTEVGDVDHNGSVRRSMPKVLDWFRQEAATG
ncbi:acyl CoA:acetate/3-ketoacid CoA transferase [Streptosporangium album]|uniref:Acyl CoA:acetate/3-ketoacid CoA transferase n=1 Tax=Streptosporangium album TaxID=47479 RepID=A0A7W7RRK7_9ACTN|nr:hypothetical protein [Streptosporangium album]MBB4936858.1 acyl CoA:acetate/3-ketoacid CoA transferase [Streptosporangium album]